MNNSLRQVIVVEDEFDSMQMISAILRFHGIDVLVAHNGKECLGLLNNSHPTMVLTDLAMPEMDGWETLKAIRANPETQMIPVVAMTAYHSVDVAQDALNAGFNAFFTKPIRPKSFIESLAKLISSE